MMRKLVPASILDECFTPETRLPKKVAGQWITENRKAVPGYVFLVTNDVERLSQNLVHVPMFTKLLGNEDQFIPLDKTETAWLDSFTHKGNRVIDVSSGVMTGDQIRIVSGPLQNHSGQIASLDRHKRIALVRMKMFGRETLVKVGLEITSKTD